jgi:hypothetical protein
MTLKIVSGKVKDKKLNKSQIDIINNNKTINILKDKINYNILIIKPKNNSKNNLLQLQKILNNKT